jgi:hypothetical protein
MAGFHDKSLHLLPKVAEISEVAVADVEARIGRPLPAAVREWYVCKDACAILQTYSNEDPPVALDDLGRPITPWRGNGNLHDLAADGLLYIRSGNQGVCGWAVRLHDADDPAVVVNYADIADLSEWVPQTDTFSDYIFCSIWDCVALSSEWLLQAQNGPLTEGTLDSLRLHFRESVRTYGWPGDTQYRFEGDGQWLLIWSAGGADWFLAADDELSLAEAARKPWHLDDVGKAFWSNDKLETALARIAAGMATR